MSQFSASYHLITSNQQDAVQLLKRAGLHGYVFPEKDGIVTFVIQQESDTKFRCCEQLIIHNTEPLMFFMNAEDHGWLYEIYDKNELAAGYSSFLNEEEITQGFDFNNPESFVPREDINYYIYSGEFQMERLKECIKGSMRFEEKIAIIQKSKAIADSKDGLITGAIHSLKEEALTAIEFTEAFGIFFHDWISYEYMETGPLEDGIYEYGRWGRFPVIAV